MPNAGQQEAPIKIMQRRLYYATGSGRRLEGVKLVYGEDEREEYTKNELPCINMLAFEETEVPFEGQRAISDVLDVVGVVTFGLHVHHRNLLIDWDDTSSRKSAFYYLARVKDVLETDYDGSLDLQLEDTLKTGLEITSTELKIEGGAAHHTFEIAVTYKPHLPVRGTRADTVTIRHIGTSA